MLLGFLPCASRAGSSASGEDAHVTRSRAAGSLSRTRNEPFTRRNDSLRTSKSAPAWLAFAGEHPNHGVKSALWHARGAEAQPSVLQRFDFAEQLWVAKAETTRGRARPGSWSTSRPSIVWGRPRGRTIRRPGPRACLRHLHEAGSSSPTADSSSWSTRSGCMADQWASTTRSSSSVRSTKSTTR